MLDDVTEKAIKDTADCFSARKITDPQKKDADIILEVLPTKLTHDSSEAVNPLRVRLIQKKGNCFINPFKLMDESSTFSWTKDEKKIRTTGRPSGYKFQYYRDEW